jgi:hypothetical protein
VAFVDFFPDGAVADVGVAEGASVVTEKGMRCFHEEDVVYEVLHLARLVRCAGTTEAFLEAREILCGLAMAHWGFYLLKRFLLNRDRRTVTGTLARVEKGKNYIVQDGDVLNIRFSV